MSADQAPARVPALAPPPNRLHKALWIGCGVVLLLFLLACTGVFLLFQATSRTVGGARGTAESFLSSIERSEFGSAERMLTPEARKKLADNGLRDLVSLMVKRHGKLVRHTGPSRFKFNNSNGVVRLSLTYSEECQKGQVSVQVDMKAQKHEWQVERVDFAH